MTATKRSGVYLFFSVPDPHKVCLLTCDDNQIKAHQDNGNPRIQVSTHDAAAYLMASPKLYVTLDDSAWQTIAPEMVNLERKAKWFDRGSDTAFFEINEPDLPCSLAHARLGRLSQFPDSMSNQQALCELIEIVMASENLRPVNLELFSAASLNAPRWAHRVKQPLDNLIYLRQLLAQKLQSYQSKLYPGASGVSHKVAFHQHLFSELSYLIQQQTKSPTRPRHKAG